MPNWEGSDRKSRLPPDWPERRRRVLLRDANRCQHVRQDTGRKCGEFAKDVDHIEPSGSDELWNLQALCDWHHSRKSGREGGLASGKARRERKKASAPKHPGLL